jgi:hypothetical protein
MSFLGLGNRKTVRKKGNCVTKAASLGRKNREIS